MIRLLKSSVAVLYYLDNFVDEQYSDYTLPSSSIWKAIENEIKDINLENELPSADLEQDINSLL